MSMVSGRRGARFCIVPSAEHKRMGCRTVVRKAARSSRLSRRRGAPAIAPRTPSQSLSETGYFEIASVVAVSTLRAKRGLCTPLLPS
jgi:hypothetical protein